MIETSFTASHQLTLSGGKECHHSHDWLVRTAVCGDKLDEMNMVIDFNDLKEKAVGIIAPFNGARLEELDCFKNVNVSAETVAKYIYDRLETLLPGHVKLRYIEITEAPGCCVKYFK